MISQPLLFLSREHGFFFVREKKRIEEDGEIVLTTSDIRVAVQFAMNKKQKL